MSGRMWKKGKEEEEEEEEEEGRHRKWARPPQGQPPPHAEQHIPTSTSPLMDLFLSFHRLTQFDELLDQRIVISERRSRGTVYDGNDWKKHRSSRRHCDSLKSMMSSRDVLGVARPVFLMTMVAMVVATWNELVQIGLLPRWMPILQAAPITLQLTSASLALLLVFRTNAAYARFDEARRTWGGFIGRVRDLTRQALAWEEEVEGSDDCNRSMEEERRGGRGRGRGLLLRHFAAYAVVMKYHFRHQPDGDLGAELREVLPPREIIHMLNELITMSRMSEGRKSLMHPHISGLIDSFGGCERIFSTPIPLPYTRMTSRFMMVWHFLFPISLWRECGWGVIPATFFSALALFLIEEVGVYTEEPFHLLALEAMCDQVKQVLINLVDADCYFHRQFIRSRDLSTTTKQRQAHAARRKSVSSLFIPGDLNTSNRSSAYPTPRVSVSSSPSLLLSQRRGGKGGGGGERG
ncbi:hypothetical protein CBR_g772 [Chara braunii]|uniref:Uncharacterized protein n=1 Tax=Chara braunii TaxID=69332 RepID=A0A388KC50_CHABU|nr:hypothetical protein CBR_g772 [Chara braunii]|eukprot:GBG67644.1 hypothetical protein CBR_g772 [Chara braunii]